MSTSEDTPLLRGRSSAPLEKESWWSNRLVSVVVLVGIISAIGFIYFELANIPTRSDRYAVLKVSEEGVDPLNPSGFKLVPITEVEAKGAGGAYPVAYGQFVEGHLNEFHYLTLEMPPVETTEEFLDSMRGLGYMEGSLTCNELNAFYANFASAQFEGKASNPLTDLFIAQNWEWTRKSALAGAESDEFWMHVGGIVVQMEGILEGYLSCSGADLSAASGIPLELRRNITWAIENTNLLSIQDTTILHLLMVSANGDLFQIQNLHEKVHHSSGAHRDEVVFDDGQQGGADGGGGWGGATIRTPVGVDDDDRQTTVGDQVNINDKQSKHTKVVSVITTTPDIVDKGANTPIKADTNAVAPAPDAAGQDAEPVPLADPSTNAHDEGKKGKSSSTSVEAPPQPDASKSESQDEDKAQDTVEFDAVKAAYAAAEAEADGDDATGAGDSTSSQGSGKGKGDGKDELPKTPDHCSALIKVLKDGSDILFGHTTWDDYQNMAPRIFKRLRLRWPGGGEEDLQFSSSPGMLSSVDDYYTVNRAGPAWGDADNVKSSSLVVIETSIDVFNNDIMQFVVPESLLSWMRVRLATQLASSGSTWAQIFQRHYSGTYVNQWMVLDLTRFDAEGEGSTSTNAGGNDNDNDKRNRHAEKEGSGDPHAHIMQDGLLTVLEELPGLVVWQDVTNVLRNTGYWASYNLPYFSQIAERSGAAARCKAMSDECFHNAPRARQFAEIQGQVDSLEDMEDALSYNNWQYDPISQGDSCRAIACREDLEEDLVRRMPFGAIDAKVSSLTLVKRDLSTSRGAWYPPMHRVRLGPTQFIGERWEPFCWKPIDHLMKARIVAAEKAGTPPPALPEHHMQPECYDGPWQVLPPRNATWGHLYQ